MNFLKLYFLPVKEEVKELHFWTLLHEAQLRLGKKPVISSSRSRGQWDISTVSECTCLSLRLADLECVKSGGLGKSCAHLVSAWRTCQCFVMTLSQENLPEWPLMNVPAPFRDFTRTKNCLLGVKLANASGDMQYLGYVIIKKSPLWFQPICYTGKISVIHKKLIWQYW